MERWDEIERYFEGEMNEEETRIFEYNIQSDELLRADVKDYEKSILLLKKKYNSEDRRLALLKTLKEEGKKHFVEKKTKVVPFKKALLSVAAVAAIVLFGTYFLNNGSLYEEYESHESVSVQLKGGQDEGLIVAVENFNTNQYDDAVIGFENYLMEHPKDLQILKALGISYLEINELEKAINVFENNDFKGSVFEHDAQWYEALTYLKMRDENKCVLVLKKIVKGTPYYKQAQDLLDDIQ